MSSSLAPARCQRERLRANGGAAGAGLRMQTTAATQLRLSTELPHGCQKRGLCANSRSIAHLCGRNMDGRCSGQTSGPTWPAPPGDRGLRAGELGSGSSTSPGAASAGSAAAAARSCSHCRRRAATSAARARTRLSRSWVVVNSCRLAAPAIQGTASLRRSSCLELSFCARPHSRGRCQSRFWHTAKTITVSIAS